MPKLADLKGYRDAIILALEYYGKRFTPQDTARLVAILSKADVIGLIQFAYERGNADVLGLMKH